MKNLAKFAWPIFFGICTAACLTASAYFPGTTRVLLLVLGIGAMAIFVITFARALFNKGR